MKQLQNRIAEGGLALPVAALFGIVVWLFSGLLTQQLWPQLACFVASVYLMVELTNQNALLRVRSRMVSSTFIILSSTACFLYPHFTSGVVQLCFIVSFLFLFQTYQDSQAVGRTFYAFLAIGLASLAYVHVLFFVPLLWVLMATQLQALSARTWLASLIGLATPYWFTLLWLLIPFEPSADWAIALRPLGDHFAQLTEFYFEPGIFTLRHILVLSFTLLLTATGIIHFWQYSFEDKIRIRLLYGFFTTMTAFTLLFIFLQPQHFNVLMRICFISASTLIAHVATFTSSRVSNILFFVSLALALAITIMNV